MGIRDLLGLGRRGRGPYRPNDRERESTRKLEVRDAGGPAVGAGRPGAPEIVQGPRRDGSAASGVATRVSATPSVTAVRPRPEPAPSDRADTGFYLGDTEELPCPAACRVVGVLIGVSGEQAGVLLPVSDGENTIGRDEASDIRLPGRTIPRTFASLVHRDGAFSLRWRSDKNPPTINGRAIGTAAAALRDGDRLTLGDSEFSFRTTHPTATAAAADGG